MTSHSKALLSDEELKARYAWSLDRKIEETCLRIIDWHSRFGGRVSVSFSGGLDSTVLLDLVRNKCGYPEVPAVFSNTGLEFPENVHFVRSVPNVHEIRPKRGFRQVIETFGYPVVSKRVSQYVGEVQRAQGETATKRLRLTGMTYRGTKSRLGEIPDVWKPLVTCGFRVSDKCCDVLKKEPLARAMKIFGPPFVGTRAEESMQRELSYKFHGCNAYHMKSPRSTPIAFWSSQDVRAYIQRESLPYSPLYDMGYDRSGCMWCLLGAHHSDDNRFELLAKTHPRIYAFCRDRLGLFDVLRVVQMLWDDRYRRRTKKLNRPYHHHITPLWRGLAFWKEVDMSHPHQVAPTIVQQNTDGLISNLDYDLDGHLIFAGYAAPGSTDADTVWQIQRLNWVNGKLMSVRFAGNAEFNQSWANRSSLVYA